MSDDEKHDCKLGHRDLLQVTGVTEKGDYTYVRHLPDHSAEVGVLRIPEEGKSMQSPIALKAVNDQGLFEVEDLRSSGGPTQTTKGPAKITTEEYRTGWNRIFGGSKTVGQA
jgi:hypothetical protein